MNIGTGITEGEVAVGVGSDLIVTGIVGGKEIVAGAGAVVQVLIITKIVGEADMMMSGVVEAGPMIVPILGGACPHVGHLGTKVLMHTITMKALLYQKLLHQMVELLILEAHLHVDLMLMNEGASIFCDGDIFGSVHSLYLL